MENSKIILEFGERTLYTHEFTTVVSLPKQALKNCSSSRFQKVNVQLIIENGEKYLKLIPILELKKVIT